VFVRCPLDTLVERDVKVYKKAIAGEIANFTGVQRSIEDPLHPEVVSTRRANPAAIAVESHRCAGKVAISTGR